MLATVRAQLSRTVEQETVTLSPALGRILAADLMAVVDLPPHDSSAEDGFAVRAADF